MGPAIRPVPAANPLQCQRRRPEEITATRGAILIVEDNKTTSQLLSVYLEREGFNTIPTYSGRQAVDLASQHELIFAILDLMLPDLDGWEVCRRLRSSSAVPILILSALGDARQRIKGFKLGADDYVTKPFSFRELVARVKAILRRANLESSPVNNTLFRDGLVLNRDKRQVTLDGDRLSLTRSEYRLLEGLMAAPGRVFLRDELIAHLYPHGGVVVDRVIDVHIGNLRQKIEADPSKPRYILTARGLGYQFADGDEQPRPSSETPSAKQPSFT